MGISKRAAVTCIVALVALPVVAAPIDAVKTRILGYREVGAAFKAVNDGLRGEPQLILIQQSARQIRNYSRLQYSWFPAGSGPQAGLKTAAKQEIWTKATQFKAAQDGFARQADAFQNATNSGNAASIRAEARKLGLVCKACHDQFRIPKS